jgi:hypothetical protein
MPVLISRCAGQFDSAREKHRRPRPSSFAWPRTHLLLGLRTLQPRTRCACHRLCISINLIDRFGTQQVAIVRGKRTIYWLQSDAGCKKSWHAGKSSTDLTGIIPNGESSV